MSEVSRVTAEILAASLMRDVYYPFSACVWFGASGSVLGIRQFDTHFCSPEIEFPEETAEIWLLSNHEDGNMTPFEEDWRNCRALRANRLLIVSEDCGVKDIHIMHEAG